MCGKEGSAACRREGSEFYGDGDGCASVVGVIEFSHVILFRNQERARVCAHVCVHVCVFRWILSSGGSLLQPIIYLENNILLSEI